MLPLILYSCVFSTIRPQQFVQCSCLPSYTTGRLYQSSTSNAVVHSCRSWSRARLVNAIQWWLHALAQVALAHKTFHPILKQNCLKLSPLWPHLSWCEVTSANFHPNFRIILLKCHKVVWVYIGNCVGINSLCSQLVENLPIGRC